MNKTSLAISALVIVAATAMGLVGFAATQSAAAQNFNTFNSASQSATQEAAAASGGASGSFTDDGDGSGTGGTSGSISITQSICQQIAQSGAFGLSENIIKNSCD
jgi:hypothetical protein